MKTSCTPLKVFVMWHPDYIAGGEYAKKIYNVFSRDEKDFAANNIGIPIYFYTTPQLDQQYFNHVYSTTEKIVFVLLINGDMVQDKNWKNFVCALHTLCYSEKKEMAFLLSVAESDQIAKNLYSKLVESNLIILEPNELSEPTVQYNVNPLCFELAHDFCRLLFNQKNITEEKRPSTSPPPVTVFVSHARNKGKLKNITTELNNFILNQTSVKTFIDVRDISHGSEFECEINENIAADNSVFLAVYTDDFSSRPWCQKELLKAKCEERPIVLVDALEKIENRRFPYGANVKVIRLGSSPIDNERYRFMVFVILLETLKVKYNSLFLKYVVDLYKKNLLAGGYKEWKIFNHSPELYTALTKLRENVKLAVYPEPPISKHELEILKTYRKDCEFITPTLLPCINPNMQGFLSDKNISLSVSDTGEMGQIASTDIHLSTFYLELCRYLLASNANLLYSGSVDYKKGVNFIEILQELIQSYSFNPAKERRIIIHYLPSLNLNLTNEYISKQPSCFEFISVSERNSVSSSLTKLRNKVAKETDARIVVGGKTRGYLGKYPGIIEEAFIAVQNKTPLFVLGAYGGASALIVKWLSGKDIEFDIDTGIVEAFKQVGFGKLNNGLTKEENEELASCEDITRSIALILKGLKNSVSKGVE